MGKLENRKYDVGITWNWEYDRNFIYQLNDACVVQGLKPYIIHHYNFAETINLVKNKQIEFRVIIDRASDTDPRFLELLRACQELSKNSYFINHPDYVNKAIDKILFHIELVKHGISVPLTFIYYPTDSVDTLSFKLRQLGTPVVMKPADGVNGGGAGVLLNAQRIEEVMRWHEQHRNLVFLLQKQIVPKMLDKKPAWFRVFYALGKIIPCWWNPVTHVYDPLTKEDTRKFRLEKINKITLEIARLSKLAFFSTEITIDKKSNFLVIDYINDQCDMRRKSKYQDGVPDEIVDRVVSLFIDQIKKVRLKAVRG